MNNSIFDQIIDTPVSISARANTVPVEPKLPETTNTTYLKSSQWFDVEKLPMPCAKTGKPVPKKHQIFVGDNMINVVSGHYEIHQPKEIAAEFQRVADKCGMEITGCFPNQHNGGLMISAKYQDLMLGGERTEVNVILYTSHDGKRKTVLALSSTAAICENQLPMIYANKGRYIMDTKHYKGSLIINAMGEALEYIPQSIAEHEEKLQKLKDTRLTMDDFVGLWADHYKLKKEQTQYQSKVDKIRSIYRASPGQEQRPDNSAYKALQAVTYFNTHEGKNTNLKNENAFFKGGDDSLIWLDELLELDA